MPETPKAVRRGWRCLLLALAALAAATLPPAARAEYPERELTWLVPYAAGSGSDRWARILSVAAIDVVGQPIHVRIVTGAAGVRAWGEMLAAPPDGHTVYQGTATPVLALLLDARPPFPPTRVKVVGFLTAAAPVLMVRPGAEWRDWRGLLEAAGARPGGLRVGGTLSDLVPAAHLFGQAEVRMAYAPYPDTPDATADFLAGKLAVLAAPPEVALSLGARRATPLLSAGDAAPDPALRAAFPRLGLARDFALEPLALPRWVGVHPDTPDETVQALSDRLGALVGEPSVKALLARTGAEARWVPAAEAQPRYAALLESFAAAAARVR